MKTIAVVILNWNGRSLLEQFLPQVIERSQVPGVSVVVADNASSDDSIAWLKTNHPSIHRIELDNNYGFAGGYNRALQQVEADYYLLLNSDVLPENNWLLPLIDLLDKKDGSIGAIMPKIRSHKQPDAFEYAGAAGGFIDKYGYPFCRGRMLNVIEQDLGQYDHEPKEVFWASGAALLVNANLYRQIGGLDEHFFAHMEEIDLCWRLKNNGYRILCEPQSVVYHVGGATLDQSHPRKTYLNFRNNLFLLVKNLPRRGFISTLFIRMMLDGVAAFKFLASLEFRFFWAVLHAHLSFYKQAGFYFRVRKSLLASIPETHLPEVYPRSFIVDFYLRGKHKFTDLLNY